MARNVGPEDRVVRIVVALGLAVMHPIPLLFVDKPRFQLLDIVWPVDSPQQPVVNMLGAIAL